MSTGTVRNRVGAVDFRRFRRVVVLGAGALFWGWLVVRWVVTWVTGATDPFVPAAPFERAALVMHTDARTLAATQGPLAGAGDALAGFWNWLAGFVEFLVVAVTYLPDLAVGAWLTVVLTVASILLGLPIAVAVAVARIYGGRGVRWSALGFTELIRGTPLLAQLFVVYFGLNLAQYFRGLDGGPLPETAVWVAVVGFTINSAAYQAEYIRAAVESVDAGQLTAARAVGLSKLDGIRYVVLPQGLRYAIPGWSNELVYLIKYSSLATFITVPELFTRADEVASETFQYTELYALVGLFYIALVLSATAFMTRFEHWVAVPGLGVERGR